MKHYVYRITDLELNKHYYGVRSTKSNPKNDLGFNYFSSSSNSDFIMNQKINPSRFKYKIVCECKTRIRAIKVEIRLHKIFDVGKNSNFYNKALQTSTGWDTTGNLEVSAKISATLINKPKEWRCKNSSIAGKANLGKKRSDLSKQKYKNVSSNRPDFECEYCGKIGQRNAMVAWHGENCSKNPKNNIKRIWVNDGKISTLVLETEIPEGYVKGQIRPRGICEFCGCESTQTNITRYHNKNCKKR